MTDPVNQSLEAMMDILAISTSLIEAAAGYKAAAEAAGFSPAAAEVMAYDFHTQIVKAAFDRGR